MSQQHPIIAVTGSAGAGTTLVQHSFADIFRRLGIKAANVHGDAFFRYNREDMAKAIDASVTAGKHISHFGPEANLFTELEALFRDYSATGAGTTRHYATDEDSAALHNIPNGEFTAWTPLPADTDLLFYEGLHGGVAASTWTRRRTSPAHRDLQFPDRRQGNTGVDVSQYVDLLIGVVPAINLEWIQKIYRDCSMGTSEREEAASAILRRLNDYIHFIVPQFSITDINFQRVPMVDTSNPFDTDYIPTADESLVVIHFRDPKRHDFPMLMDEIPGAFMSRPNTLVAPGGAMVHALEVICTPIIRSLVKTAQ
jgi:phosphoribulokinase